MAVKPFLRWAGSKRQSLAILRQYWGDHFSRYVEPFAGSAAFFFSIRPPYALLSDTNSELVDAFTTVRESPVELARLLHALPQGREAYYEIRALETTTLSSLERAARFIYLNRFCFNGLYRTNNAGRFNVPYAPSRTGSLPSLDHLSLAAEALRKADLRCVDFEETLSTVTAGDFVYLDPPFAVRNRRIFKQYGPDVFGSEDLARLSRTLRDVHSRGAAFVVSYADSEEATQYLSEWPAERVAVHRNIAGFAKHRRADAEMIYTNITFTR